MSELFVENEVRKALSLLIAPGCVFEVRALDAKLSGNYRTGIISGYFDNADACITELRKLTSAMGMYITLNPVNPALLARRANRLDLAGKNARRVTSTLSRVAGCSLTWTLSGLLGSVQQTREESCAQEGARNLRYF